MNQKALQLKSSLLLLITATIWGFAFVAQRVGMDYVGPFTFNSVRCFIGAAVLLPVWIFIRKNSHAKALRESAGKPPILTGGFVCGVFLCLASNSQQLGIKYTTVGKAGFITACYIVLVPVFGMFLKKKTGPFIWAAVLLAVAGLYLLCITDGFSLSKGDLLVMICAVLFAFQILAVDHYSPLVNGVELSIMQLLVCGFGSAVPALIFEHPHAAEILSAWQPVLYAGVLSCGVAYTLQNISQKNLDPTVASLIMSLESCISVLAGWLILGQTLSTRELAGCIVMFAAIVLAQLPSPTEKS